MSGVEGTDYGFNVASGIVANCNGVIRDCYLDIHFAFDPASVSTTMIGGITTNRYSDFGIVKIYNSIVKVDATSDILSSEKIHALKGAIVSVPDEEYVRDVFENIYVVSNFTSVVGRNNVGYTLPAIYADDAALIAAVSDFGLTGTYWSCTAGNVPKLVNMD